MSTDEQSIRDLIATWHRATAAGHVEAVLQLMAEDVVFLIAGQPPPRRLAVSRSVEPAALSPSSESKPLALGSWCATRTCWHRQRALSHIDL
jgi:uncharacterized protein (TIGR02246 family)